jgi:tetratricopeptide (TPR) repeat protein
MFPMTDPHDWQARVDALWGSADGLGDDELVRRIDELAAELPADDPRGPFEAGGARDSTGDEAGAEEHYRRALELGLAGRARTECLIQLASTVRNLGRPAESLRLLDEASAQPGDLADAVAAFRALTLASLGETRLAASVALRALAPHLPQYTRSVRAYADELALGSGEADATPQAGSDTAASA